MRTGSMRRRNAEGYFYCRKNGLQSYWWLNCRWAAAFLHIWLNSFSLQFANTEFLIRLFILRGGGTALSGQLPRYPMSDYMFYVGRYKLKDNEKNTVTAYLTEKERRMIESIRCIEFREVRGRSKRWPTCSSGRNKETL